MIEFFHTFYPQHEVSVLVTHLKHLQDNLSEIHDLAVEQASMKKFRKEMCEDGNLPESCGHAMKTLGKIFANVSLKPDGHSQTVS